MIEAEEESLEDQGRDHTASRRIHFLLVSLVALFIGALTLGTAIWCLQARTEALREADSSLRHTASLLAEAAASNFIAIDKILIGTAEVASLQNDPPTLLGFLRRQVAQMPVARALLLIGPDGTTRMATNLPQPFRRVNLADRPYFRHHLTNSHPGLHISEVMESRNDNRRIMVLSRRIETPDGSFAGVVAATVDLERLSATLRPAAHDATDSALLLNTDGVVLARIPDHERYVGKSLAGVPAFEQARGKASGSGEVTSPLDGSKRIYAFHRAETQPLLALASHRQDAVLADWRRNSILLAGLTVLAGAVVGGLALLLARQLSSLDMAMGQLARARIEAEAASRAKSSFLANMSHELRTPLNSILGFSDALLLGIPGHTCETRCHQYLGHIRSSGQHLLSLINDILDLSKIEAGKVEIDVVPTQISALVEECVEIIRGRAEAKDISITATGLDSALVLPVDPRRLRQILLNLLSNSVKFTPNGGRIIIEVEHDSTQVTLTVNDSGIGMSPDEIDVALTPFGQVQPNLATPETGTGLGLPLSRRLAEMHGGSLSVTSIPGRGTTVTVQLPLGSPGEAPSPRETATP